MIYMPAKKQQGPCGPFSLGKNCLYKKVPRTEKRAPSAPSKPKAQQLVGSQYYDPPDALKELFKRSRGGKV